MDPKHSQSLAILRQTHQTLAGLTVNLPEVALDFRASPQEWSTREILAHLVDDEMYVMRTRLERMIKEERPDLAPHDERKWYANRNTTRDALSELLDDFGLQRTASLGIIDMLRDEDWRREGYQPEYGQFTAAQWLDRWAEHDTTHIKQIESNLALF